MKCPTCPDSQLIMSDRSGIEIDFCPQCRGVWLDRGELDKIIDRSSQQLPPSSPPTQRAHPTPNPPPHPHLKPDDSHYGYQHEKRKKSWLGELFD